VAMIGMWGCGNLMQQPNTADCVKTSDLNGTTICLPKIEGMRECVDHPSVDSMMNALQTEPQIRLGYYLSDADYLNVERAGPFTDDYILVASSEEAARFSYTDKDLDGMHAMLTSSAIDKGWDGLKESLIEKNNALMFGKLYLIEKYESLPHTRTAVLLMTKASPEELTDMATIMTYLIVSKRLIVVAYYSAFTNEAALQKSKEKNDAFIKSFMEANQPKGNLLGL
jgi:hypothetical protein